VAPCSRGNGPRIRFRTQDNVCGAGRFCSVHGIVVDVRHNYPVRGTLLRIPISFRDSAYEHTWDRMFGTLLTRTETYSISLFKTVSLASQPVGNKRSRFVTIQSPKSRRNDPKLTVPFDSFLIPSDRKARVRTSHRSRRFLSRAPFAPSSRNRVTRPNCRVPAVSSPAHSKSD
jgi:hypothetical protein